MYARALRACTRKLVPAGKLQLIASLLAATSSVCLSLCFLLDCPLTLCASDDRVGGEAWRKMAGSMSHL